MIHFEFSDYVRHKNKINNELVVPTYRQFCRDNNLPFHFADEQPEEAESIDPKVLLSEMNLHHKAMEIFNQLKQDVVFFDGMVVRFQFTDWGGGFDLSCWTVDDYLTESVDLMVHRRHLEKRLVVVTGVLTIVSFVFTILGLCKLSPNLDFGLICLVSGLFWYWVLLRLTSVQNTKLTFRQKQEAERRLSSIRLALQKGKE